MKVNLICEQIYAKSSAEKAVHLSRFFKVGPGQYGEGDLFLGVSVPDIRKVAKENMSLPLEEIDVLLSSPWHEVRLCALLISIYRMKRKKTTEAERKEIYNFYLCHTAACNNWDLVDLSCRDIIGAYLLDKDRAPLYLLADSSVLWEQRMAIVSTWTFIRSYDFRDTLALAERLMGHKHDLIHKAVGWMLREVGKKDEQVLTDFLERHALNLPRTALRYAIEHYAESRRQYFLKKK